MTRHIGSCNILSGAIRKYLGSNEGKKICFLQFAQQTETCHPELDSGSNQSNDCAIADRTPFVRNDGKKESVKHSFAKRTETVFSLFTSHFLRKRTAFTLAEVLITLGIIAIVAALTMPVLMSKYREQVTMNKLKKFYSTMSQAQLRSIVDHGDMDTWDFVQKGGESNNQIVLDWFNKYFGQYLQKAEIIDKKTLNDDNELVDDGILVMLPDGSVMNFGGFAGGYMHIYYYTDYKTFKNGAALQGKDAFLFGFNSDPNGDTCLKRFNAYACDKTDDMLKNGYVTHPGCNSSAKNKGSELCTRILQKNNWQVPKNYPFKF